MLWRRRKDGFEWREYVRTTILVRRRNRRDRIEQAAKAAVGGIKEAGERGAAAGVVGAQALGRGAKAVGERGAAAGAVGAQALGRGAKAAGQQGVAAGIAGLRAANSGLRAGIPATWELVKSAAGTIQTALAIAWTLVLIGLERLWRLLVPAFVALWRLIEPILPKVRKLTVAFPLAAVAFVALAGSFRRIPVNGWSPEVIVALLVGSLITLLLIAALFANGVPGWIGAPLRTVGNGLARIGSALRQAGPSSQTIFRGLTLVLVAGLVVGSGWLLWQALPSASGDVTSTASLSSSLKGRAVAVSGDILRIQNTDVRLSGIEAPISGQTCMDARQRPWSCGAAAEKELSRVLGRSQITCEIDGIDDAGVQLGTCHKGETDVAAELVRSGHVFAESGFFSTYGSVEDEARAAKAGIWSGEAERPADYRAQKWEEASQSAPDGCPIKGNVNGGKRIYLLPWSRGYERAKVSEGRGERWFCSEAEARAAGWKSS